MDHDSKAKKETFDKYRYYHIFIRKIQRQKSKEINMLHIHNFLNLRNKMGFSH